jgi:hypothetical protein
MLRRQESSFVTNREYLTTNYSEMGKDELFKRPANSFVTNRSFISTNFAN